jgi:cytochrome c6
METLSTQAIKRLAVFVFVAVALTVFGALAVSAKAAAGKDSAAGAELYKNKCIACHDEDGSGDTAVGKSLKAADLRSPAVQKKSNAQLAAFIASGGGNMPGFRNNTTDQEIHELVEYIRVLGRAKRHSH